jgi:hypothetical protein
MLNPPASANTPEIGTKRPAIGVPICAARIRGEIGASPRRREDDAIHLFTMERTCDAIAQGELRNLGINRSVMIAALVKRIC